MKIKRILHGSQWLLIAVILDAFVMLQLSQYSPPTAETFYLMVFSLAGPINDVNTLLLIEWFMVYLIFFFAVCNSFLEDFQINYLYIFPRIGTKRKWLHQQTLYLLLKTAVFWALLFCIAFLYTQFFSFAKAQNAIFYIELYIGLLLSSFCIVFLENVLSLQLGAALSFIIESSVFLLSILIGMFLYDSNPLNGWLFSMMPTLASLLQWHSDSYIIKSVKDGYFSYPPLNGFTLLKSWGISFLYLIVMHQYLYRMIEKKDSMNFVKGEK